MAVLITSARLLLPFLDRFHDQVEEMISDAVGATVDVRTIEAAWHGFGPQLRLRGVRIMSDEAELLSFEHGRIGLDLWQSLNRRELHIGDLMVSGIQLMVTRDASGKIGVEGFDTLAAQRDKQTQQRVESKQALLRWFFSQSRIVIESSELTWRDLKLGGRELLFSDLSVVMRNQDGRHQLDGSAELPIHLGKRFSFALDLSGDILSRQNWNAQGYLEGGELKLAQWLEGQSPAGVRIDDGLIESRLWLEWHQGVLQRAEGQLSLRQLLLTPMVAAQKGDNRNSDSRKPLTIDLLSGSYLWQRNGAGWLLTVDDFILGRENRMWRPSQMTVATSGEVEGGQVYEARIGYARVDDISALLSISDQLKEADRQRLSQFAPNGTLINGYMHYKVSSDESGKKARDYVVDARFEDIGITALGKLPGASGIDGEIRVDNNGGYLALKSNDASLSLPKLFRAPLEVTQLNGDLYWQLSKGDWMVESHSMQLHNSDATLALSLGLKRGERAPEIALHAEFSAPSVANTSHYLPVGIMPRASVDWLDSAIVNGTASAGEMLLYGPLERFPYKEEDGLFDIRFNLTDGILDYAPGWPRLEEVEAEVIFSGSGMEINAVAAKSLDADVTQVTARIADLRAHPALLEIDGNAEGGAEDALDFVRRSPLAQRFGAFAEGAEVTAGRSWLDLSIDMPLANMPVRVAGAVRFAEAGFYLADRAIDMSDVNGDLHFTESSVEIDAIQARLLGMETMITAQTVSSTSGVKTEITADGTATADDVRRLLEAPLLQRVEGEAAWQAKLVVPSGDIKREATMLTISSDLKGMAADYPYPLGKEAVDSGRLLVETAFPRALDRLVVVEYGSQLQGLFDVDEKMGLQRGAITFGAGEAVLPQEQLISVSGKLSHLILEEWLPLLEAAAERGGRKSGRRSSSAEIERVVLEIEEMSAFGEAFYYTALDATLVSGMWHGAVSNHLLGGVLKVPTDFEHDLLEMKLDYLILSSADEPGEGGAPSEAAPIADPRALPAMEIESRYFNYGGQGYGELVFNASKRQTGLHIDRLHLFSPLLEMTVQGDWQVTNEQQCSVFNIRIHSDDLGEMLSTLDFADSIHGGSSDISLIARWPGSPTAFALERLSGNMHLKVEDGRLLDVEPGAGRVFGLISLQALPRRLTLDFSDMFTKGFSFDHMEGDFEINGGDATTTNFSVVGPSATIMTTGRVGLVAKDYDQEVIVEPHVGSSLPMVGAVVANPVVGATIFFAQKMFKLDEVAQVKYSVTGSWDAPLVTREEVNTVFDRGEE